MKLKRIFAVILRILYHFRHSLDRAIDAFYWPLVDLLLWGLTSLYFSSLSPETTGALKIIVAGILFWIIIFRSQYEVSGNLLMELWDRNLVNLFVSPLMFREWVCALVLVGIVQSLLSLSFASLIAFLLYKVNIFIFGFHLIPFIILLAMTGWWLGFIISSFVLRFGTRIQAFAWTLVWVISPFSAIYFPVSVLPDWAQIVSKFVPASYVFEGAREFMRTGVVNWQGLEISFVLNLIYIIIAFMIMEKSFKAILNNGLVRLY